MDLAHVARTALRREGHAVGPSTAWRIENPHFLRRRIDDDVDAGLAGEPDMATLVEGDGVEISAWRSAGSR